MLDKTKNYKIDVSALNEAERIALQKELFSKGYRWFVGGQKVSELDADVLFLSPDMELSFGGSKSFSRYDYPTLTVSDIMPQPEERTLRDWFAGQALFGLMAMHPLSDIQVAKRSFEYADAMLKERNK